MKKLFFTLFVFTSIVMHAQEAVIPTFLEKWENSKTYLIGIAEAMPEAKYTYKPNAREMSFQEQLLHIKANMDWLSQSYFSKEKAAEKQKAPETKAAIIQALKQSFDAVAEIIKKTSSADLAKKVDFFAGPKTKLQILNLLQDHVTHHRGQLIVYLNLNEIQPPRYVGW